MTALTELNFGQGFCVGGIVGNKKDTWQQIKDFKFKHKDDEDEYEAEDSKEFHLLRRQRDTEIFNALPRPHCCEQAELFISAALALDAQYEMDLDKPCWKIRAEANKLPFVTLPIDKEYSKAIKCCPWCSTKMPVFVKNPNPPKHIHNGDGYYCDTCGERNMSCYCDHPISIWSTL